MRLIVLFGLALALGVLSGVPAAAQTTVDSVAKFTTTSGTVGNTSIFEIGGNLGVGTVAPFFRLEVHGSARIGSSTAGAVVLKSTGPSSAVLRPAVSNGSLLISDDSEIATRGLTVANGGFIGIGTGGPTARLHVAGDVVVDGVISATYQDVAEWVESDAPLAPGTIVAIDASGTNRVTATGRAYDVAIAGAVSAQPGVMLGVPGAGRILVAQSGRVRVKVDARYGAIRPGDLLVSSPTPGHAMRSEPLLIGEQTLHRPGTVLGKALEGLRDGTGDILALLTLQ